MKHTIIKVWRTVWLVPTVLLFAIGLTVALGPTNAGAALGLIADALRKYSK